VEVGPAVVVTAVESGQPAEERGVSCRADFMIEPFEEGAPGPHVMAAIEAVRSHGFEPEIGPFGTSIYGDPATVIAALQDMLDTAYRAGASRISLQMELDEP